ncbi:NAD-dependent epimerase/dehydratase family protein [Bordetella genomosp. 9]|uniref:Epimerase n=1 Tax=Bordetella genomosp. 9 TaxID=1416803 RepID=A0A1W6Z4H9_9BORD|nr:NAD-dependent epimerase/dehydratase family protein [Bordetella genomosp. 9]ARP88262.1 epimerase [Bordetella genomosp. 9]
MKTFLVTGGAGFIGSHLVDALLSAGHAVRVLDDLSTGSVQNLAPAAEFIEGNIGDLAVLAKAMAGCDGVFHMAAIASVDKANKDWLGTHHTNLSGTIAVLDQARRLDRLPVVLASSAAVYGDGGSNPITEDFPTRPISAYGADKLGCELHARVGTSVHGVPAIAFRFFNVYGPRQDPSSPYSGVISIFASRIAAGQTIVLHGDGEQIRDFIYVADVVSHLIAGMESLHREGVQAAGVFNVCTGRSTTIKSLACLLGEVFGKEVKHEMGPARAGDIKVSLGSRAKVASRFALPEPVPLPEGLKALAAWMCY